MSCSLHLALGRSAANATEDRLQTLHWSLGAPRARVRCGAFKASRDGADVPYRLWLARAPRAAVVLLHGAFDYSRAFDEIGPKLARLGVAAVAFDQRGFGASRSRGCWSGTDSLVSDASDAAAFLRNRCGARLPVFLLGESMGGAVAIHAAARQAIPDLTGLVLIAPGALASAFRRWLIDRMTSLVHAVVGDAEFVVERTSGWELSPAAAIRLIGDPLVMRRIRPEIVCGMAALAHSAVAESKNIAVPVLTMVGGRDNLVRTACVRQLHDNLAGEKSWLVIEDGPHLLLHWRRSAEVLRHASRWILARLAVSRAGIRAPISRSVHAPPQQASVKA